MSLFPEIEPCPTRFCVAPKSCDDPTSRFDVANYMLRMAIEDFEIPQEYCRAIVTDINRITCVPGQCNRLMTAYDALAELNVFDMIMTQEVL